ncbi:phosphatidylserine decarboxylase [Polymorphobacter glacialis]|uniref:Phosphatidylserine decarboxylase n=1 Tax=Sandarakinorhabdus glacialis TaxID=1614636 RepID=A0A916ZIV4_9SPHN|nr:DUF1254 domain-containing protein [Polymorphobacter glacialis]GGD98682.1 phosphatidylserine decarboxylase [Polymorphobacter glacialis]
MRHLTLFTAAILLGQSAVALAIPAKPGSRVQKTSPNTAKRPATVPATLPNTPEIAELRRSFRFAFPIYEFMRTRSAQLARAQAAGVPNAVNVVIPKLTLADATTREVTTPNNDTLYGSAWLDLAGGPVLLDIPALPNRYNSAALMSIQTDNTAILGTRTGSQGGRYAIVGPGFSGTTPLGAELIRSASNDAWLLIRVLVKDDKDLPAAAKALGDYKLTPAADSAAAVPATKAPAAPDARTFLAVVNLALSRSSANLELAARAATFGLANPTPDKVALFNKYLPALRNELKGGLSSAGEVVEGWSYPHLATGDFGENDDLRSQIALGGLAALPRIEAMYLTARSDKDGAPLEGSKSYRVKLPRGLPVGAFWSLTMYQQEADGRLFFVPNDLNRFAVGDRSRQLRAERDGSYEIFVQAAKPEGERVVNWLPAPKGKFVMVFRGYLPRAPLLDGSFRLPPVEVGEVVP